MKKWRVVAYILLGLVWFPYVLAVVYRLLPAPSTLMLARILTQRTVERQWVPLGAISPRLIAAVINSEDARFCSHYGIDLGAIRDAVRQADARDRPVRGTSTLTQQTAKNLFLWNGRSWLRKALEAPLALWLSLIWPKERVIEVYLNIAEWGEGVFGIEAAAKRAFGMSAAGLNQRQAALLAVALPNPKKRDAGRPTSLHRHLAERLIVKVQRGGADLSCVKLTP